MSETNPRPGIPVRLVQDHRHQARSVIVLACVFSAKKISATLMNTGSVRRRRLREDRTRSNLAHAARCASRNEMIITRIQTAKPRSLGYPSKKQQKQTNQPKKKKKKTEGRQGDTVAIRIGSMSQVDTLIERSHSVAH